MECVQLFARHSLVSGARGGKVMTTPMSVHILSLTIPTTLVYLCLTQQIEAFLKVDPDVNKNVVELIQSKGYVAEKYTVRTADGYLLGTFRIPYGRSQRGRDNSTKRPVALLTTSLAADSSEWVLNFPNQSLGFILADSGYDVWLACSRGCTYSQKNVNIARNTDRFWDFSWEEVGTLDLPATVDFVLAQTKQEKLILVGHSMGTSASFVFLSMKPEYNKKIKALLTMAPVANVSHTAPLLRAINYIRNPLYSFVKFLTHGNLFSNAGVNQLFTLFCSPLIIRATACNFLLFFGDGMESPYQYNQSRVPVYTSHFPGGGSAKQLVHYGQLVDSKRFARYDYGINGNLQRYGQRYPPEYPVGKITTPTGLFWSSDDQITNPTDVANLRKRLTNVVEFYQVPFRPFTHLDFVVGINAYQSVYKKLLTVMDQYK